MIEDSKSFFYKRFRLYKTKYNDNEIAAEFAFYDLKNKYQDMLELKLLIEIPELMEFLKNNPQGEKSFFHFGKQNSQLSQFNAALTQKFI